jgi:transglutaminase-like putative cysteine protease
MRLKWAIALLFLALPLLAAPRVRVMHEPLPPPPLGQARADGLVPADDPKALAAAIRAGTAFIPQPKPGQVGDNTPVYRPRATPHVGIDRRTGADGKLHYQSVFDPEVVPWKREIAFDRVLPDVTMGQSGTGLAELPPQPLPPLPGRELFWGHLRIELAAGESVPLPSVAPDSRVLQWQAQPQTPLQLRRDHAGNFSVTAAKAVNVDLRFVMDAPSSYFAAPLGTHSQHKDPEKPTLDPGLQARAQALWPALGVNPKQDRKEQLLQLAHWFRAFAPGEPPLAGQDPLADLVLSQKGVCRHRALGFLVIAHSLGIPAHYVMNDAHAFVEVWAPLADGTDAWQRLDLGGGAESLDVTAAENKRMHVPEQRDPYPRPPGYGDDATDVRVDGRPVGHGLAGAKQVHGLEHMSGVTTGGAQSAGTEAAMEHTNSQPANVDEARRRWLRQHAQEFAAPIQPPRPGLTTPPPQTARDNREATRTLLRQGAPMAWVGEALEVSGQVMATTARRERLQVEIWLIDPRKPLQGRLLGVAITGKDGSFSTRVAMPVDGDLTAYDVVARFAGTSALRPSDSAQD